MYFSCKRIAVIVALTTFARIGSTQAISGEGISSIVHAEVPKQSMEMIVQPNKCVALTQGRRCYAKVNITWRSEASKTVCLVEAKSLVRLNCWEKQQHGQYIYEMESAEDVTLSLVPSEIVEIENQVVIASTTIKVSWLYEGSARKRRWRLF